MGFTQYIALLEPYATGTGLTLEHGRVWLPLMQGRHMPMGYYLRTSANVTDLEQMLHETALFQMTRLDEHTVMLDHESGKLSGILVPHDGAHHWPHTTPVRTSLMYKTVGRERTGKQRLVAYVTQNVMRALNERHIPAVWYLQPQKEVMLSNKEDLPDILA